MEGFNALLLLVAGTGLLLVTLDVNRRLRTAIVDLDEAAGQVSGAAGQVSSSSQWLAQTASQQAASLEETSSSSRQISHVAHQNAEGSEAAAELTIRSRQQVTEVSGALHLMVSAMAGIGESSSKISRLIRVIDELHFRPTSWR
ncbi:MAG: methyl-accepting chemotaxis protein [Bryobacterales bacterium]|nr:methyl-accepting chemotaxis protein [Bryobacterales bacterium]